MQRRSIVLMLVLASSPFLPQSLCQISSAQPPVAGPTVSQRFSAASVRRNKSDEDASLNVSPTSSDVSKSTGGLYLGRNIVLISYISFAYKLTNLQLQSVVAQAPWTAEERYNITARAEGDPSTEAYRQMLQALLQERFKLAIHPQVRQVPVYRMVLAVPGKLGPRMRAHAADDSLCLSRSTGDNQASPHPPTTQDGFPGYCGDVVSLPASSPGRIRDGGRNVSVSLMAATLAGVGIVGRPLLDQTGLNGNVDFVLEWAATAANIPYGEEFHPDDSAPAFVTALKEQLGIKLQPGTGPVTFFVVDHIERPDEN